MKRPRVMKRLNVDIPSALVSHIMTWLCAHDHALLRQACRRLETISKLRSSAPRVIRLSPSHRQPERDLLLSGLATMCAPRLSFELFRPAFSTREMERISSLDFVRELTLAVDGFDPHVLKPLAALTRLTRLKVLLQTRVAIDLTCLPLIKSLQQLKVSDPGSHSHMSCHVLRQFVCLRRLTLRDIPLASGNEVADTAGQAGDEAEPQVVSVTGSGAVPRPRTTHTTDSELVHLDVCGTWRTLAVCGRMFLRLHTVRWQMVRNNYESPDDEKGGDTGYAAVFPALTFLSVAGNLSADVDGEAATLATLVRAPRLVDLTLLSSHFQPTCTTLVGLEAFSQLTRLSLQHLPLHLEVAMPRLPNLEMLRIGSDDVVVGHGPSAETLARYYPRLTALERQSWSECGQHNKVERMARGSVDCVWERSTEGSYSHS